ncbi:alpha/beta hydrolase [Bacillus luteolus]|uniref:Alpha/beta hydrolase n=1 Tax=Litchfieldia luteola TaxID=682179 RepID=A0ABR9QMY2_9BACI|nr:alpha/beta hydrolase [Cytobacillus luteolus]MBE4909837.1 alpha/beta hydrolase [Cytobacillus luteolus]MBP1942614.1 pimeloyl-ACP methyl ester carboxylesterase [Cytobacillus luteolus]
MSKEIEVIIEGTYPLAATLTLPEGNMKFPLVVMVHGSGPTDRDSNAKGMPLNIFKEISEVVAKEGFASIRYDKRGIGASKGDYYEAGVYDLIDDARAVLEYAKKHQNIDGNRVILLGHSEGSILAPFVNEIISVDGMILLSGTAEPLAETMKWQRQEMINDIRSLKGFEGWVTRLIKLDEKITKMNDGLIKVISETDKAVIRYKGKKMNAKWNREHLQFDVSKPLQKVNCPVLAITGTKDVNVKLSDLEKIKALVQGECETHIIQDMTHMLRKTDVANSMSKIMNDYKKSIKQPIDSELKDIIITWLRNWKSRDVKVHESEFIV